MESFNNSIFQVYLSTHTKNLRMMKKVEPENKEYWHFVLRFETCNHIGLVISGYSQEIRVKVKGVHPSPLVNTFSTSPTYYICQVKNDHKDFDLKKDDLIVCFFFNTKKYFSKYIGFVIEPDVKHEFIFGSLSNPTVGSGGGRLAHKDDINQRFKDMTFQIVRRF